ncbi:MAG: hypothetical protein CSA07_03700 [Bacteroidia bacterium]|nr:MAG: hypothetical protein CSA07_03700 [Bacteroidia bacterium]
MGFDPKDDNGLDWTQEYPDLDCGSIPLAMFDRVEGEQISSLEGYIEGIPERIFYEIEHLYEKLD